MQEDEWILGDPAYVGNARVLCKYKKKRKGEDLTGVCSPAFYIS
jgi:hypothetical protein